jgi:hypothetical protein
MKYLNFAISNARVAEPGQKRLVEGQIDILANVTRVQMKMQGI